MMLIVVRNNKAPVKCVFDYMEAGEVMNPNPVQKAMLSEICDGVEKLEFNINFKSVLKTLNRNDYLYYAIDINSLLKLVGINK